jgi:MFS family permease
MLAILLGGQLMASMDASILVVATPSLRAGLHATGGEMQLIVASYTLTFASLVVTGARLGDILGRRRAFVLGLWGFVLASLAGGLAPSPALLIAARTLQGAAGALLTPQVLSIIQVQFEGDRRARAIGAYSMILAVGVAVGQVVGGLLVSANLLGEAWRPALLVNVPVGLVLLAAGRRSLPRMAPGRRERLDLPGATLLALALLALVVPLTFGRDGGWPLWIWPAFAACALAFVTFVLLERRRQARSGRPLFDLDVLRLPGVAAGVGAILLVMAAYAGILVSLTLYLQGSLRFTALHAGLTFALYASGFATASLTWTRARSGIQEWLPLAGPGAMGAALLAIGLLTRGGGWHPLLSAPLLFAAGAGHACTFSPLSSRLASTVSPAQAPDLSGLILTASLVGQVLGVASFVGVYLGAAPGGATHALALTTAVLAATLLVTSAFAILALRRRAMSTRRSPQRPDQPARRSPPPLDPPARRSPPPAQQSGPLTPRPAPPR